jgi:hypothetical protein
VIPLYDGEERAIEVLDEARRWTDAGILSPEQFAAVRERYRPSVKRVNFFLRVLFAVFTGKAAVALVALPVVWVGLGERPAAVLLLFAALLAAHLGDRVLIRERRFYRCGVEEALLGLALAFAAAVPLLLFDGFGARWPGLLSHLVVLGGAVWLALRYGYALAAFAAVVALGALPFHASHAWRLYGPGAARVAAAFLLGGTAVLGHLRLARSRGSLPRGYVWCLETVRLASLLGLYLVSNSYLHREHWHFGPHLVDRAPWSLAGDGVCAALTAVLPAGALAMGIRGRDRALLWFGALSAVASIVTLKYFFHLGYLAEELVLAGLLVGGVALGLIRWLGKGPDRRRGGFTAEPLLEPRLYGADFEALAAVQSVAPEPAPSAGGGFRGGGGSFGGGGASSGF